MICDNVGAFLLCILLCIFTRIFTSLNGVTNTVRFKVIHILDIWNAQNIMQTTFFWPAYFVRFRLNISIYVITNKKAQEIWIVDVRKIFPCGVYQYCAAVRNVLRAVKCQSSRKITASCHCQVLKEDTACLYFMIKIHTHHIYALEKNTGVSS